MDRREVASDEGEDWVSREGCYIWVLEFVHSMFDVCEGGEIRVGEGGGLLVGLTRIMALVHGSCPMAVNSSP